MNLLLWRWSTTAQITSGVLIAIFFIVLARSVRRVELRPWVYAWLANLAALLVTTVFWFWQPDSRAAFLALRWGYLFSKTMFVVLLARGAWDIRRRSPSPLDRRVIALVAVAAAFGAVFLDSIDRIGLAQSSAIALLLGTSAILLLVTHGAGAGWLAMGFSLRAALAVVEALAYGTRMLQSQGVSADAIGVFLASHSSFDTGAEWVIALGCVLTIYRTIQQELTRTNADLLAAKEALQELVDRDTLTGLSNRRALPAVLRDSLATGATILFFDLNDFKVINDSYGHQTGDECLKRFSRALQSSFGADDRVIRYAGDEFVVVTRAGDAGNHVEQVRERLRLDRSGPPIAFSVGMATLPVEGDPDAALRAADEAMYREKSAKARRLRAG